MVERRFLRDFGSLKAIYTFVREFLSDRGVPAEAAFDVDVMAEELFTNMVKYGRGSSEIALALDWNAPTLTLRLRDFEVERFDVTRVPSPDVRVPLSERKPGGLGIHLVRQIADHIEYSYENRSSTVTVTKRIAV